MVRRLFGVVGSRRGAWQWSGGMALVILVRLFSHVALDYKRSTNLPPALYFVLLAGLGMVYRGLECVAHRVCCVLF
jgi:hypothetical protein